MGTFRIHFTLERKRFFRKRNCIVLFLFAILSFYFVQEGVSRYEDTLESREKFQQVEQLKVKQYVNYTVYGIYGCRLLFIPSPMSVFFTNSSVLSDLTANIDSTDILNITRLLIGRALYEDKNSEYNSYSGFVLLFGSLLILYFGYESLQRRNYLKFIAGSPNFRKSFFYIQVSRLILLSLYFLFITACSLVQLWGNGLNLTGPQYISVLYFLLMIGLMILFSSRWVL